MPEIYLIQVEGPHLNFTPRTMGVPDCVLSPKYALGKIEDGLIAVCRMGDPDLIHCIVFKREDSKGGIFAIHDKDGLLFAAVAESNLAYALSEGYFGELVANARYGVDVYENMEEPDD